MPVAPSYNRVYNFTNYQTANPATPLPGNQVDAELNGVKATTDAINANLNLIQRADGQLANASVGPQQIAPSVLLGFNPPSSWSAGVSYSPGQSVFYNLKLYVCMAAEISAASPTPDVDPNFAFLADFSGVTLAPGSVGTTALAAGAVTSAKIATGAVGSAQIAGGGVAASNIAFGTPFMMHRLTLATGTPVMTSTVTGWGAVYLTPYVGNLLPIWDGSQFRATASGEISNLLSDATYNPAAAVANSVYDLFAWNNGGTVTLSRGPAWSSLTARSAGTNLTRTNGVLVNALSITNGPAAGYGTYVGTIATDAASASVTWNLGSSAAGGGQAYLNVWNYYNRVNVAPGVQDSTASHTYSSATVRPWANSTTARITFVIGMPEDPVMADFASVLDLVATGATAKISIGLDSTTTAAAQCAVGTLNGANGTVAQVQTAYVGYPFGAHYLQALEVSDGTNANVFYGAPYQVFTGLLRM